LASVVIRWVGVVDRLVLIATMQQRVPAVTGSRLGCKPTQGRFDPYGAQQDDTMQQKTIHIELDADDLSDLAAKIETHLLTYGLQVSPGRYQVMITGPISEGMTDADRI